MTNYELANTVLSRLIIQGVPSMDPSRTRCQYRGENGNKCGAGLVIDDAFYQERMDRYGLLVGAHIVDTALLRSGITPEQIPLLRYLQQIHDRPPKDLSFRKYIQKVQGDFWQATLSDKSDAFVEYWFKLFSTL